MGKLRRNYNTFLHQNANKGIPNLMFWICASNAVVFVMDFFFKLPLLELLIFKSSSIAHGEVWRLFSYIFTFACMAGSIFGPILGAVISILFYHWIGKLLEAVMGRLRFNIFYFSGILLIDLYFMLIYWICGIPRVADANYLNLSMFLAVATLIPDERVYIYFIIPVKMKWLAWLDLALCVYYTISSFVEFTPLFSLLETTTIIGICLIAFYPWVSILNYFLFFGRKCKNLFPSLRQKYKQNKRQYEFRRAQQPQQQPHPDWAKNYRNAEGQRPYRHKCTVCGRTDTQCPDLEFRYCSRCKGYFCYCVDHINNHSHVE
ncbi:MAG: hypothetical protein E7467_03540 [Ruminococcaceae bacterium]|nr:hypothetical protein [Oscillospiraceae bacterium]